MPTHTSSPHRFLAPSRPPAEKARPKPLSALRNSFTGQTLQPALSSHGELNIQPKNATPAKRFVIAPHRRTHSKETNVATKDCEAEARLHSHVQRPPRPKPHRKLERVESIEETPQSSPPAVSEDDNGFGILQTMEHGDMSENEQVQHGHGHGHGQEDEDDEILFVTEERNKRRRVSPRSSPASARCSEPTTPSAPHNATTHRFVVPPPRTPALFSATDHRISTPSSTATATRATATPHRPAFILPPQLTSPVKPSKPLPEIFSPSRKTQKYVPNGLASTLQGWIIETANTGFAAQERSTIGGVVWGRDREDGVRLRLRIHSASSSTPSEDQTEVECFPGLFVFVRGEKEPGMYNVSRASNVAPNDSETRVLLAGQGGTRGTGGVKIKIGDRVGIRAPLWDVDVGGEKWSVGVDWVLL
jgi:hypothetical protein